MIFVIGCSGGGSSGEADENASNEDKTPSSVPTGLTASAASSDRIDLTWKASNDNVGVAGYKIYRNDLYIKSVTNDSASDTDLKPNTQYCYAVSSYDTSGNESGMSNESCVKTLPPDTKSPISPVGLNTEAISASTIALTWNATTDDVRVKGYNIYRDGQNIGNTSNTSFNDKNLNSGTEYCYTVTAYDASGNESGMSNESCAVTWPPPDTKPPVSPVGLNTAATSSSTIALTWNATTDDVQVKGYNIYRDGQYIDNTSSTSFNDENLNSGTEYCYSVSAYDTSGNESGMSNESCATTWLLNCLVIGDSIGEATHTNDACDRNPGEHRELMDCYDLRLGSHDLDWSFMGGSKSWSIARRLGCASVNNKSKDGDEWKDALNRARDQVQAKKVGNVILQLGSNDVCADYGHDYGSLSFVQPTVPGNIVSIEAEHFIQRISKNTHKWEPEKLSGASITSVRAQPDNGTSMPYPDYLTSSPRLDYRVNFTRTGIHYVWLRGFAKGPADNLVHAGLDGQPQSTAESIKIASYNEWTWTGITENGTPAMINVPSVGIHTLNVYMHQDGFRLDKIALTADKLWAPSNQGPPESSRSIIKPVNQSGYELVPVEAEHYHYLQKVETHGWEPDFISGYSGSGALRALPDNGAEFDDIASSPRLDYNISFDAPGIYYVWVRGYATSLEDNAVHIGVDGINQGTADKIEIGSYDNWTWTNKRFDGTGATIEVLSAGIHTVNIWMHKDGFRLDKIILAKSSAYQPSGNGPGEQWANDLGRIAGHIDDTMLYLTEKLPGSGKIYWSGISDISKFRDLMVNRKHDHAFKQCQSLWDLDLSSDTLQGDAVDSLCKGEIGVSCEFLPDWLEDELVDRFLNEFQEDFNADAPCGRMLDSRNTQADRDEARRFNKSLNDLMEQKAAQYQRRKGVAINFTQTLWYSSDIIRPYFISRIDCYHPNRLGQLKLAQIVWAGHGADFTPTDEYFFDGFDDDDECTQEFTTWDSCWEDGGDGECDKEFICSVDNSGWYKFGKESNDKEDHWLSRDVGDLSDKSEVWVFFKHKRDGFDNDDMDWVRFSVWTGTDWQTIEEFSENNDEGNHCSQYYNLTEFKDAVPFAIRFKTNNSRDMKNGDKLMFDDFTVFSW